MKFFGWYETYTQFLHDHEYKTRWYNMISWMMGGMRAGLRHIHNYPITVNTFYDIVKGRVAYILRRTYTSCTITPTISYFKFVFSQQYTMVIWVIGVRVSSLGPISVSPITTNILSCIVRGKVAGIFIPLSMFTIIKYNIHPQVAIIATPRSLP